MIALGNFISPTVNYRVGIVCYESQLKNSYSGIIRKNKVKLLTAMIEREREVFYPSEENLGKNCIFWNIEEGCIFPKKEMEGRRSCEGIVDDVCLFLKNGRRPKSLTSEQLLELKTRVPGISPLSIPPGDTQL